MGYHKISVVKVDGKNSRESRRAEQKGTNKCLSSARQIDLRHQDRTKTQNRKVKPNTEESCEKSSIGCQTVVAKESAAKHVT